jgi:hypothetical protein
MPTDKKVAPDEGADRGLSLPLADNAVGIATWLVAHEPDREES